MARANRCAEDIAQMLLSVNLVRGRPKGTRREVAFFASRDAVLPTKKGRFDAIFLLKYHKVKKISTCGRVVGALEASRERLLPFVPARFSPQKTAIVNRSQRYWAAQTRSPSPRGRVLHAQNNVLAGIAEHDRSQRTKRWAVLVVIGINLIALGPAKQRVEKASALVA
jgi:hypothetical protein